VLASVGNAVRTGNGPAAELREVSKHFGPVRALDGLSLAVHPGEVVFLLGPNGAGKTTALNILVGLRPPDRGQARLLGLDPRLPQARDRLGVVLQDVGLPYLLRVREVVDFVRSHYADPLPRREFLELAALREVESRLVGGLSGGQYQRLAVALAFAGRPQVVVLDEPTVGFDVEARRRVWEVVRHAAAQGVAVLMSSHVMEEAEALATRVVVIDRGRVVAEGTVADIKARVGFKRIRFSAGPLPELPGTVEYHRDGHRYTVYAADADGLIRELVVRGVEFRDLEVEAAGLDEAFLAVTGRGDAARV
jgi:ABC-2 type transport system ATP-binding protein